VENLLFLAHRIPYPPNKGDKIRSYHLLKHLVQHYRVHLGTFIDDADDWQHVPRIAAMCADSHFAKLNASVARIRSLGALLTNRTLSLDYYRDRDLRAWVEDVMRRQKINRILVFSSAMAQYAASYPDAMRVIDFVDIDSDKWRQYAEKKTWPMSWLYGHEARQLLRYEKKVAREFDASLFVSQPEADLFKQLAPESASKIAYFNNGVDTEYFSPSDSYPNPYPEGKDIVVFAGAMDYWPNIDAVQWFARDILPAVRARSPNAAFYIVGARPSPEVKQLTALEGVFVTGTVPDIRPYVAHATLSVAPLRVARGIQNKVLEAMSMAKTVVVSEAALEGIHAVTGRELILAKNAEQFVEAVTRVLAQPDLSIGLSAREKVQSIYGWDANLAHVDSVLESRSDCTPSRKELSKTDLQDRPAHAEVQS
jgi:sugar transferase (PEP-CTERM/EpsH1 system associated)